MLPFAYYFLKVLICSGILYGYYWLLLRNKVFHQYNRFYLIAIVALALLLPFIKINFWQPHNQRPDFIKALKVVSDGDAYVDNIIIASKNQPINLEYVYLLLYLMVSLFFLFLFIRTLFVITHLLRKYPRQTVNTISFINTDYKSTPFSFLKYIFWNKNIDIESVAGQQIFKHEVAHVQQKHTYDKLFINTLLIFFWANPFFWFIRKELNMIHEFIADKKAVEGSDTEAFAAMILQATYPQHRFALTNNFFYSPIKRRLAMLVKNKNSKISYWNRLLVLPIALLLFAAFTLKTKSIESRTERANINNNNIYGNLSLGFTDTIPFAMMINVKNADENYLKSATYKHKALVIIDETDIGNVGDDYLDKNHIQYSSVVVFSPDNAIKKFGAKGKYGVIKLTQKSASLIKADSIFYDAETKTVKLLDNRSELAGDFSDALIYVENKEVSAVELKTLNPEKIQSIEILKGEKLDDITEAKGKKAVIYISLKAADLPVVVVTDTTHKPLYVIDGEIQNENFDANKINPNDIESMNVLKGKNAIEKYGEKGKYGVVEIISKRVKPLYVVDGEIKDKKFNINEINQNSIDNINVRKGKEAVEKYGDKGVHGVVEINTKKNMQVAAEAISGDKDIVFTKAETEPEFPGGNEGWKKYLMQHLNGKITLSDGWAPGLYKVMLQFIVHTDGSITDIITTNYPGSKTAQHCIDLIKKSPKWTPAMQNGRPVNIYRKQPISFEVSAPEKTVTDR
jgi:beta-lactamase regulating signal transducer with metallopeptidase domain